MRIYLDVFGRVDCSDNLKDELEGVVMSGAPSFFKRKATCSSYNLLFARVFQKHGCDNKWFNLLSGGETNINYILRSTMLDGRHAVFLALRQIPFLTLSKTHQDFAKHSASTRTPPKLPAVQRVTHSTTQDLASSNRPRYPG
jgi:hypothetical protein